MFNIFHVIWYPFGVMTPQFKNVDFKIRPYCPEMCLSNA